MLRVKLKAVPDPDYAPHTHEGSVYLNPAPATVSSLEEAAHTCRAFITEHDLGGGNWAGGEVVDVTGRPVAYVSYNGRTWPAGERIG